MLSTMIIQTKIPDIGGGMGLFGSITVLLILIEIEGGFESSLALVDLGQMVFVFRSLHHHHFGS